MSCLNPITMNKLTDRKLTEELDRNVKLLSEVLFCNAAKENLKKEHIFGIPVTREFKNELKNIYSLFSDVWEYYFHEQSLRTPNKQGKYSDLTVAIIDDYETNYVNECMLLEKKVPFFLSHGDIVEKNITENLPGVNIERRNVSIQYNSNKINEHLKDILSKIEQGKKYDAINLSMGYNLPLEIKDLKIKQDDKEITITNENINKYRDKLREIFKKEFLNQPYITEQEKMGIKYADEYFALLKKISEKGVKIFVANNNECGTSLWYSDLADLDPDYENCNNPNIFMVSANDSEDRSTPLSDIHEQSSYKMEEVENGIDITGDGIADFYNKGILTWLKNFSNEIKEEYGTEDIPIETILTTGNSLGTPNALTKKVKEQYDKEHK